MPRFWVGAQNRVARTKSLYFFPDRKCIFHCTINVSVLLCDAPPEVAVTVIW